MASRETKLYKCDRCGRTVEAQSLPDDWSMIVENRVGRPNDVEGDLLWDLCKGCTDQFERFMQGDRAPVE